MPEECSSNAIEAILSNAIADFAEQQDGNRPDFIDPDASFTSFGLDSLAMVNLVALIEEIVGLELEPELAFNYPTIRALAAHLSKIQVMLDEPRCPV